MPIMFGPMVSPASDIARRHAAQIPYERPFPCVCTCICTGTDRLGAIQRIEMLLERLGEIPLFRPWPAGIDIEFGSVPDLRQVRDQVIFPISSIFF
jgi:hypothetical protein